MSTVDKPIIIGKRVVDFSGEKLRRLIEKKQMTQAEIADAIGVSKPSISQWLHGVVNPSIENLYRICNFFGVPATEFSAEDKKLSKKTDRSGDVRDCQRTYDLLTAAIMMMRGCDDPCQFCKYAQELDGNRFCRLGRCNWEWKLAELVDDVISERLSGRR